MIKQIPLGKTNEMVTQLGLGCINFGTLTDEKTSHALIETYLELGGNYLDTSNNYAFWNDGKARSSELVIGAWNRRNPSSRKNYLLATKLGALPLDPSRGFASMQGTGRNVVFDEVERSLDALQTDYIDLLYLHVDDLSTPQEETMEALATVVRKGYVKYIGCSNFRTWRIECARQICAEHGFPFFCAVQQRNSYLKPVADADFGVQISADKELESYLAYYKDMTLFSHTSLLYGAYLKDTITDSNYDTLQNRQRLDEVRRQPDSIPFVLRRITEEFGGSVALFTTGSTRHLKENMAYFS